MVSSHSTQPICPKCGYDQSGIIAAWEDQCPMQGRCSECGLDFAWGDVFDLLLNDLEWYSEHAKSVIGMVWRTPKTLIQLILPYRFWRDVDVLKRVSIWRLMIWVIFMLVGVHLLVSIPNGMDAWKSGVWSMSLGQYYQSYGGYGVAEIIFEGLAHPYFEALPQAYSISLSLFVQRGWPGAWYEYFWIPVGFELGFFLLWLVVLCGIPHTRKVASVRNAHIIRAALLSFLMIGLSFEMYRLLIALHNLGGYRFGVSGIVFQLIVPIAMLWQIVFWATAIRIGWRVKPWKLLVVLGTTAALLGGLALRVYVFLAST